VRRRPEQASAPTARAPPGFLAFPAISHGRAGRRALVRGLLIDGAVKIACTLFVQLLALLVINYAGYAMAAALHLPVPGNLVGMLLLLALLVTGAVPLRWIEGSAALLTRHLAFFFIPITVGLMGFADLFLDKGPAILLTLVLSAAAGICVVGLSAQMLGGQGRQRNP
jgi:holin-like protein